MSVSVSVYNICLFVFLWTETDRLKVEVIPLKQIFRYYNKINIENGDGKILHHEAECAQGNGKERIRKLYDTVCPSSLVHFCIASRYVKMGKHY